MGEWYIDCILIVYDSHITVCILLYTVNNFSIYSLETMSTKKKHLIQSIGNQCIVGSILSVGISILHFASSVKQILKLIIIIRLTCQFHLKVGRTAPMLVLSFFLHSILFAGSVLDSFQCLRSLLIVSFHVFFGLPRPRCPTTSNSVMLLIQPSFLTTCPNQRSRLYRNKVCMLLIPSFLRRESELMWSFKRTLHVHPIIARSLRCSLRRSLTLGAQHSLAYNKTVWIYMLYICPRVMYEGACEVNIGKSSSWNLPHAHRILVITLKSQPPPATIVSPR